MEALEQCPRGAVNFGAERGNMRLIPWGFITLYALMCTGKCVGGGWEEAWAPVGVGGHVLRRVFGCRLSGAAGLGGRLRLRGGAWGMNEEWGKVEVEDPSDEPTPYADDEEENDAAVYNADESTRDSSPTLVIDCNEQMKEAKRGTFEADELIAEHKKNKLGFDVFPLTFTTPKLPSRYPSSPGERQYPSPVQPSLLLQTLIALGNCTGGASRKRKGSWPTTSSSKQ